jgi:type VI secretion system protein ImpC
VCNLAYTFSITRIAHYVKCIMRDNIGSTADAPYIQQVLSTWLSDYVTEVTKPDDLTVQRFPFKAASVTVQPSVRDIGRYDCAIAILPHVQFEGMDVTLRLESRLGK